MYRITTLTKDDGTVIKSKTEELQTERNWNKRYYKLRRTAVGELMRWRTRQGSSESIFYSDDEVLPMTTREKDRYLFKKKQAASKKRAIKKANAEKERKTKQASFFAKYEVLIKEGSIIVLDTETTGLTDTDEILQLAIINGEGTPLFNRYFRPENHVEWPEAESVNGIRPADVVDKTNINEHLEVIQGIIDQTDIIVAYNAAFDLKMLKRCGVSIPTNKIIVDMMILFAEVYGDFNESFGDYKWKNLSLCADYYGYHWGTDKAHDALADCKATLFCTQKMRAALLPKLLKLSK